MSANAPWAGTGYGIQAALIGKSLRNLGHEVAYCAYWGLQGGIIEWDGFTCYPQGLADWGHDIVDMHARHFEADFILGLQDVWPLSPDLGHRGVPWVPMVPIDSAPVAQGIQSVLNTSAHTVVAYSRWGQDEFKRAGIEAAYVPHGFDPATYYQDTTPQSELKEWLGFEPDSFLIGMVAANKGWPSRKGFDLVFDAFSQFAKECPEARLYLHSVSGSQMQGPNLNQMAAAYGIADKVRFANPYYLIIGLDGEQMRRLYSALDVLASPSLGEGFGVPALESQACGTPVILTDFSAQTELCGAGWTVQPARMWWTPLNNFMAEPSIPGILAAFRAARVSAKSLRPQATAFAQRYAQPEVEARYWKPFLKDLEYRILGPAAGGVRAARAGLAMPAITEPAPISELAPVLVEA